MKTKFVCMLLTAAAMTACSPPAPPPPAAPEPAAAPQAAACAPTIAATPAAAPAHGASLTVTLPSPPTGDVTYYWAITAGAITNGQGSPTITIEAPAGETVVATVEIGGLAADCQNIGSAVVQIP